MWKRSSVALCTAALTIMSIFLGAGTYAYTTGGSFILDFSSPDTIKPVISGLSPGETVYIVIKIPNPTGAPVTSQMRLTNVVCDENGVVEPEQEWYDLHGVRNDIDAAITFGLWIDRDGDTSRCDTSAGDEWIIDAADGIHIDEIAGKPIPLGVISPGKSITVVTSYHMDEETGNWAQSDTMTFNIELTREEIPTTAPSRIRSTPTPPPPPPNMVVEEVPANQIGYVVDASDLTGVKVTLDTVSHVTVTILRYEANPYPDDPMPAFALPRYADVIVSDPDAIVWPIYVEMTYTSAEVESLDEASLGIYYWKDGAWHRCSNTGVDTDRNIVWAYMTKGEASGSPILIGGTPPPLPPRHAEFVLSDLSITPEVEPGELVTISVLVTNVGEETGTFNAAITVDGVTVERPITLGPGESGVISYTFVAPSTGEHVIQVDGLTGSFMVVALIAPPRPAEFVASDLVISPSEVQEGGEVTVTVTITNIGEEKGTHTFNLYVDGEMVQFATVTLEGSEVKTITFFLTEPVGEHIMRIGDLTASFTVLPKPGPVWLSPGYISGILILVLAAGAALYMLYRRGSLPLPKRAPGPEVIL